jgi:hypothetical protein
MIHYDSVTVSKIKIEHKALITHGKITHQITKWSSYQSVTV